MAFEGEIKGVPVSVGGTRVGAAIIESSGKITIHIDDKHEKIIQLIGDLLKMGFADGISINPNMVPAQEDLSWRSAMDPGS